LGVFVGYSLSKINRENIKFVFKYDPFFVNKIKTIPANNIHIFYHFFSSHPINANYKIRTIQKLLGHNDVSKTMINIDGLNKPGISAKSPFGLTREAF
jgi:site-specific recombinase XerD